MKKCIICRKMFEKMSDEHVIPESMGGYYHIYTICNDCNKHLGETVDCNLISHKIVELCRFLNGLKGKKGYLPNPFRDIGEIKDSDGMKVRTFFDKDGALDFHLIPYGPKKTDENKYTLIIDKKDDKNLEKIIERFSRDNKVQKKDIKISQKTQEYSPYIEYKWKIDTKKFKLGILKIAYEFATDVLPEYVNDTDAKMISKILQCGKINIIEECTRFIGSGLNRDSIRCMDFLNNFNEKNHYLMLISVENVGLQCYVNLFNSLYIGVWLSNTTYDINGDIIIGINDTENRKFYKTTIADYVKDSYSSPEIKLYTRKMEEILDYSRYFNGAIPLFYKSGNKAVCDISKLSGKHIKVRDLGNMRNIIKTKITLKKDLYYIKTNGGDLVLLKGYTITQLANN
ncbi:HNH endonuclease [Selenomonas sputigena]|uniref:HNH endonuclease n=1 Tax=Selenomonas sputigena TaxID=69823 RepID=A0ABV3X788_9FIRM